MLGGGGANPTTTLIIMLLIKGWWKESVAAYISIGQLFISYKQIYRSFNLVNKGLVYKDSDI